MSLVPASYAAQAVAREIGKQIGTYALQKALTAAVKSVPNLSKMSLPSSSGTKRKGNPPPGPPAKKAAASGKPGNKRGPRTAGKYRGKFKGKMRKPAYRKKAIKGVVKRKEDGGTVQDAETVYIGHGIAGYELLDAVHISMIKMMFHDSGTEVTDVRFLCPWRGKIGLWYSTAAAPQDDVENTITFDTTSSYVSLVSLINNSLIASLNTGGEARFHSYIFYKQDDLEISGLTNNYKPLKTYDMSAMSFKANMTSSLTLQNVTKAGVTGDLDRDVMDNVTNNPLKGQQYSTKTKNYSGFTWQPRGTVSMTNVQRRQHPSTIQFLPGVGNGLIRQTHASLISVGQLATDLFKKPPVGFEFGKNVRIRKVGMDPGDIKKLSFKYDLSKNYLKFIHDLKDWLLTNGTSVIGLPYGPAQMMAFEKSLDARNANDGLVKIDFELNQVYACTFRTAKAKRVTSVWSIINDAALYLLFYFHGVVIVDE